MVDDIALFPSPDYDLSLKSVNVNFYDFPLYTDPNGDYEDKYGYSDHFSKIPKNQLIGTDGPIIFDGVIRNQGSFEAGAELSISVLNENNEELFNSTSEALTIGIGLKDTVAALDPEFVFPDDIDFGEYTWNFSGG